MQIPITKIDDFLNFKKKEILPIILCSETYILGNFSSSNSARMEGNIDGNIYSKNKIIIDDAALINGNITASNVEISGRVNGNIYCINKVILKNGAEVIGTIYSGQFKNEEGSTFNNKLKLLDSDTIKKIISINDHIKLDTKLYDSDLYKELISNFTN